jgi:hypothetical protein
MQLSDLFFRKRRSLQIGGFELREDLQRGLIQKLDSMIFCADQPLMPELAQHAIDVGRTQSDGIADAFLGEGQFERVVRSAPGGLQSKVYFEEKMRDALKR